MAIQALGVKNMIKSFNLSLVVLACLSSFQLHSQTAAGKALIAKGKVTAVLPEANNSANEQARKIKRRSLIYSDEVVSTGQKSKAQLRMTDGGMIALKENSELIISEYQYSDENGRGSVAMELLKGGLRSVTGAIKAERGDYNLKTPVGSIGIRGTHYELEIVDNQLFIAVWDGAIDLTVDTEGGEESVSFGEGEDFSFGVITEEGEITELLEAPENFDDGHSSDTEEVDDSDEDSDTDQPESEEEQSDSSSEEDSDDAGSDSDESESDEGEESNEETDSTDQTEDSSDTEESSESEESQGSNDEVATEADDASTTPEDETTPEATSETTETAEQQNSEQDIEEPSESLDETKPETNVDTFDPPSSEASESSTGTPEPEASPEAIDPEVDSEDGLDDGFFGYTGSEDDSVPNDFAPPEEPSIETNLPETSFEDSLDDTLDGLENNEEDASFLATDDFSNLVVPTEELIAERGGSFTYGGLEETAAESSAGEVRNFDMGMEIDFENGTVPEGNMSFEDDDGEWFVTFGGVISTANIDLDVSFASHGDNLADGTIEAEFLDGLDSIIGNFELHEIENPDVRVIGSYRIK